MEKKAVNERVIELFRQASIRPSYAKRYVFLARRLSSKFKVGIPAELRKKFCRKCNAFLVQGANCTIRKRAKKMVISCLECGFVKRLQVGV